MLQGSWLSGRFLHHRCSGNDWGNDGNDRQVEEAGVYNVEEFDPDPFMDALNKWGLPWKENFHPTLVD